MSHDPHAAPAHGTWYPFDSMLEISFESDRQVTPEQFVAWLQFRSGSDDHYELLNGRIVMTPPAGYPHGSIGINVVVALSDCLRQSRLGHLLDSSQGFTLPSGDIVEPDCSFVSSERWDAMPEAEEGRFLKVVPDLVVETLSGATATRDRGEKRDIYERNGVHEYWLIDPRAKTLTVSGARDGKLVEGPRLSGDDRVTSTVLPGLDFAVDSLFR
jgi:Uma2 family endonuclease